MFRILINRKVRESIQNFRPKSRRIVMEKLKTLQEDPFLGGGSDKERLYVQGQEDTYRLHISHTFMAFYRIHEAEQEVHVLAVMPIEQAHKRYGRF